MGCLCCAAATDAGMLCRRCAQEVPPCDGLIPDHVRSTVASTEARAWLVDGFGNPHAVAERSAIGRHHDGELVVLAASVSREHAELRRTDTGWSVRDLGSRNGTFVDGVRCQGRVALPARCVLKVGDVALYFLAEVAEEPAPPAAMETINAKDGMVRFVLRPARRELCLLGDSQQGELMTRDAPDAAWQPGVKLATLEYHLLRLLGVRAVQESDSPSEVRGCYPTKQLARDLPFQSQFPDEENVRQVVRRLRGVLAEVGADGILAVQPGRGYYLACPVMVPGAR